MEIAELSSLQVDLAERFTRFQKRENMRSARAEKTSQADLTREALEIIEAQKGAQTAPHTGPMANKIHLYRR